MSIKRTFALFIFTCVFFALAACNNPEQVPEITPEPPPGPNAGMPKPTNPVTLFSYDAIELLDGQFKTSMQLNYQNLMKYNADSLLAPYRRAAGLSEKAARYTDWGGTQYYSLDGHICGHHLSGLAMTYAASNDPLIKNAVMDRITYMLNELKEVQTKNGDGYAGGVHRSCWSEIRSGTINVDQWGFHINNYWVPWYNVHKMFAGLRDVYIYTGLEQALAMFLDFCDWGLALIGNLNDTQMETMLRAEFGGMNEIFADAYHLSGNEDYLIAAKRFSHKIWFDKLAAQQNSFDTHSNTLIPKVLGYAKVASYTGEQDFMTAATFFWNEIYNKHTVSFGGNSLNEYLISPSSYGNFFTDEQGVESCNSNNMLKLTETLFQMDPQAKHADYYERIMFNHTISTQHPEHGGYVYFTPLRPEHYRVYSKVDQSGNSSMWCCVGTGMENHARYGAFIYAYNRNELYVNLFVPSRVKWGRVKLTQTTGFPNAQTSDIVINVNSPTKFKLRIRYPWWIGDEGMTVSINGKYNYASGGERSTYMEIDRTWQNGDKIHITLPMKITVENLYQENTHAAFMRGPILLAAKTPTEGGLRWLGNGVREDHRPRISNAGDSLISSSVRLKGGDAEVLEKLQNMTARGDGSFLVNDLSTRGDETLIPFYTLHDSRYIMYWRKN